MWRVCDSNDAYIGMRERTNIAVSNWRVRSGNAGAVGRNTGRPQEDTGSPTATTFHGTSEVIPILT